MLTFKEYILLKRINNSIKDNQKGKSYKSDIYFANDFIEKYNYKNHTLTYLLSELYNKKYINDTAGDISTKVHAVSITDKGKFYLENYIPSLTIHYIIEFLKIFLGLVIGIIIENSVGIIDILKNMS